MEHLPMWFPSATVSSAIGLSMDFVGALLVAFDLWRPRTVDQPKCPSTEALLILLIDACESPEKVRFDELERARAAVSACEKDRMALAERGTLSGMYLRRTGRIGLILICLGFVWQLVGAVLFATR